YPGDDPLERIDAQVRVVEEAGHPVADRSDRSRVIEDVLDGLRCYAVLGDGGEVPEVFRDHDGAVDVPHQIREVLLEQRIRIGLVSAGTGPGRALGGEVGPLLVADAEDV